MPVIIIPTYYRLAYHTDHISTWAHLTRTLVLKYISSKYIAWWPLNSVFRIILTVKIPTPFWNSWGATNPKHGFLRFVQETKMLLCWDTPLALSLIFPAPWMVNPSPQKIADYNRENPVCGAAPNPIPHLQGYPYSPRGPIFPCLNGRPHLEIAVHFRLTLISSKCIYIYQ